MFCFILLNHICFYEDKIILKGRGFRCGSDEKIMRMWFGLEIDVVGLPPLPDHREGLCMIKIEDGRHESLVQ